MVGVNELKALKKDMLEFKKFAKTDILKALKKAEEIDKKIKIFITDDQVLSNAKLRDELLKVKDVLVLFKNNSEQLQKFKEKWD